MPEVLGWLAGALTSASFLGVVLILAKVFGVKQLVLMCAQHIEMRATARRMRTEGASQKQVARFLADHSLARAGRSP